MIWTQTWRGRQHRMHQQLWRHRFLYSTVKPRWVDSFAILNCYVMIIDLIRPIVVLIWIHILRDWFDKIWIRWIFKIPLLGFQLIQLVLLRIHHLKLSLHGPHWANIRFWIKLKYSQVVILNFRQRTHFWYVSLNSIHQGVKLSVFLLDLDTLRNLL